MSPAADWARHAGALAAFTINNLANRWDAFGRYIAVERRSDPDSTAITVKSELTIAVLERHYRGESTGDLVGLHSTVRDEPSASDEVPACWSRWVAWDIDRHDETTDPETNLEGALALWRRLDDLGFNALLLDSNGAGGYHLIVLFESPVPTAKAHAFGKWLVRDWKDAGLDSEPEVFPKQAAIAPGGFGNWLRLPGRHHTRDHFTRVWSGEGWLDGARAIRAIVSTTGSSADLIPPEALEIPKPPKAKGGLKPGDYGKDAALAASALDYLDPSMPYPEWLQVGMALTPLGREGLDLWDRWSSSSSEKYREGLCDRKWRSFVRTGLTLGTLFHLAKARGFEFPKSEPRRNGRSPKPQPSTAESATPPPALRVVGARPDPDRFNLTDMGNAHRLVHHYGHLIRHCLAYGKWLIWDGMRWKEDSTGEIYRLAAKAVQMIGAEAAVTDDPDRRKALLSWAIASESRKLIDAMIHLAKHLDGVAIEPSALDRDPWLLNVKNGTIDLQTGRLRPHRQEDLITKLAPVEFDPEATCPRWEKFEREIMDGDEAMVGYLRRIAGYGMTGDVREHQLFFFHGEGRNGKSLWLEVTQETLGDYATVVNTSLITIKHNDDHPTGLTDLEGKRFVSTVEIEDGKMMAEGLVKTLTGGDPIKARRMRQDFYKFKPTHKLILAANHKPEIRGSDRGIWDRVKLIPFLVTFVEKEEVDPAKKLLLKDKELRTALLEEMPGILALMVRSCLDWQKDGMQEPAAVSDATSAYRVSMDHLADFIDQRCVVMEQCRVKATYLYQAYQDWAKSCGLKERKILDGRTFGGQMEKKGFKLRKSNGINWRSGIAVQQDGEPDTPSPEPGNEDGWMDTLPDVTEARP